MAPTTPTPINLSLILQMETGNGGAAGMVAVATSAAKRGGKKAPGSPNILKVSNNFKPSVRRNPGRVAKQDGMSESEVAGGTPRKKVQNMVSHALRVDREKAKIAQANANEWSNEGWFKKGQVEITARRNPDCWAKPNGKGTPVKTGREDPSSGEEYLLASEDERKDRDDKADYEAVAAWLHDRDLNPGGTDNRPALALAWNPRGSPHPTEWQGALLPPATSPTATPRSYGTTTNDQALEHRPPEARGLTPCRDEPYGNPKIGRDDHVGPSVGASAAGMKRAQRTSGRPTSRGWWRATAGRMARRPTSRPTPPQVLTAVCGSTTTLEEANLKANPPPKCQ